MQEFSSVTASSYDADSLTPLLNERAAEGWSVVSIVSAGTNIVAYLSRESDGPAQDEDHAVAGAGMVGLDVDQPAEETPTLVADEPPAAVDEPAGWATEPETTAGDASLAALATQVGDESAAATAEPAAEPAAEPVLAQSAPEPAPAAPAPEPAVPAGWYADPSGRFELRYWDGSAWTEHVSRQGQQFTDPPVA
jgi:hypothetical protein